MADTEQPVLTTSTMEESRKKSFFMICDACFWCASSIETNIPNYAQVALCPLCKGTNIQMIPLALDIMQLTKITHPKQRLNIEFRFSAGRIHKPSKLE